VLPPYNDALLRRELACSPIGTWRSTASMVLSEAQQQAVLAHAFNRIVRTTWGGGAQRVSCTATS
jgi:hypothetical protein